MSQTFEIKVPTELSAITLKQYQKYISVVEHDPNKQPTDEQVEFANLKVLECFCGLSLKQAYKIPMTEFSGILRHVSELFNEKTPLQRMFTMTDKNGKTIEFGFIPKLDDISMGEFIDLDKYISDWQQMHKAMAVLYRPVKYKKGDLYLIEDYEGTDKYSNIMLDSPVNAAIGATVFFYNLGKELSKVMIHSLEKYLEQESESLLVSELNGDGINQSMHLLTEMSKNLKKLQSSPYFSV
jgi:hypothetical protein